MSVAFFPSCRNHTVPLMRNWPAILSLLGLGACNTLLPTDRDWFEASGHSPQQFERDDVQCRLNAEQFVAYDLSTQGVTADERHEAFNRTYSQCMLGRDYRERPYWKNWFPG